MENFFNKLLLKRVAVAIEIEKESCKKFELAIVLETEKKKSQTNVKGLGLN